MSGYWSSSPDIGQGVKILGQVSTYQSKCLDISLGVGVSGY